jgi:GTP:adenosylcobinamide-phosphate guanylyltransferase
MIEPVAQRTPGTVPVTGVVLAGGLGRRMGGVDKGLQLLDGRPMVAQVIERLQPQVDELLINANQNLDRYAAFGHRVVPDSIEGFAGPLAGLERGLANATHGLVATVPCDSPFLPADLVIRLYEALATGGADLAVARTGSQPLSDSHEGPSNGFAYQHGCGAEELAALSAARRPLGYSPAGRPRRAQPARLGRPPRNGRALPLSGAADGPMAAAALRCAARGSVVACARLRCRSGDFASLGVVRATTP